MKIINRFIFILNSILVVYTLFAYLSPFIDPADTVFFGVMGLGFPYLILTNIICIIYWLVLRSKKTWLSAICLIIGLPFISNLFAINVFLEKDPVGKFITVATYNMQFAKPILYADKETEKRAGKKYEKFLKTIDDIDVLCMQEFNSKTATHLNNATTFNYRHLIKDKTVAIFSKYPIVDSGILDFGSKVNICLWADIKKEDKTVRVYTAHLQSNQDKSEPPIILDMKAKESLNTSGILGLLKYYNKYASIRAAQSKEIRIHQDNSPFPSVICGDFNDPPQSYNYRIISKGLQDSFREKGLGLGTSFGGKIPALRIDYVLVDPKLEVLSHDVIKNEFSDHYIIKSQIGI